MQLMLVWFAYTIISTDVYDIICLYISMYVRLRNTKQIYLRIYLLWLLKKHISHAPSTWLFIYVPSLLTNYQKVDKMSDKCMFVEIVKNCHLFAMVIFRKFAIATELNVSLGHVFAVYFVYLFIFVQHQQRRPSLLTPLRSSVCVNTLHS